VGNKEKSYKIMKLNMFAVSDKANPDTENIRGLKILAVVKLMTMKNAIFCDVALHNSCVRRRYVFLKCQFTQEQHGATSQKTGFFIDTTMKPQISQAYDCSSD
jgi:hypothetical protein